jgi:hypothetical protein
MGKCADWLVPDDARVFENFLKLGYGCAPLVRCQIIFAAQVRASLGPLLRLLSYKRLAGKSRPSPRYKAASPSSIVMGLWK